jgi:hypothetical protein
MSKIRRSARDKDCLVRVPGYCCFDNSTTVHAHRNGGGMGMKHNDIFGARACNVCHDIIDGRLKTEFTSNEISIFHYEGIFRTQEELIEEGLIKC